MASKSGQPEPEKAEVIEELLDALDTALDRVKVLYEQYFLGIQKQPPAYLHTDVERKLRDLTQIQVRNTALRYRFATLQQKYGSYNSYWRRTLRQIENGTYTRNLYKVGREAAKTGAAVPEEILAAMPRRMREQVIRDREAALALARLRERRLQDDELLTLADDDVEIDVGDLDLDPVAFVRESSDVRRNALTAAGAYRVDESDAEFDVDAFFASVTEDDAPSRETLSRPPAEDPELGGRSSRPPVAARTATGHPRPASVSGEPVAGPPPGARATEPGAAAARSRRPGTKRPPTDEGPPSFASISRGPLPPVSPAKPAGAPPPASSLRSSSAGAGAGAATRKITGPMRAVRPPSSPGIEPSPSRHAAGRMQTVRPPSNDDTERRLSIPPVGSASPAAATRKITGPMHTVRPPSNPDPEPAIGPASPAPARTTGQAAAARPTPSGDPERRLSIPPIRAASPAAATRRITPPARAAWPPSNPDPEASGPPASAPQPGADARWADGPVARITGHSRAVSAPSSEDPAPAVRADPARTAPSQATSPLRVAPGSAAAHAATPVETLAGPFPRIPGPPSSLTPPRGAAEPAEPPPVPVPPALGERPPTRPQPRPASEAAPVEAPPPAFAPPAASGDAAAAPASDSPPAPHSPPHSPPPSRLTPPPVRAAPPSVPPRRADAPRSGSAERPSPEPRQAPPPGMTDADVNELYAKYVKAKQILGEDPEPDTYRKLVRTIHAQAPKIMEQYNARGVDFSVAVKDNQVIIRAKPKP